MEDTIQDIFQYLPIKYLSQNDAYYFEFLKDSVVQNYSNKNYNFAIISLHIIYMGIVYQYLYRIYRADVNRFKNVLIGFFHDIFQGRSEDFSSLSWQNFSVIPEKTICEFYRVVGMNKDKIGVLKKVISDRNDIMHATGSFIGEELTFDDGLKKYMNCLDIIHKACTKENTNLFLNYIKGVEININSIDDVLLYIEDDFIKRYMLNYCVVLQIAEISKEGYPKDKKVFYDALQEYIGSNQ